MIESSPVVPRTSTQLMFDRDFGKLFWGGLARTGGYWAQTLLVASLAYAGTGSAVWVGLVGAAQLMPQLVLALPMGKLADRHGPVRQIVVGSVICGLSSLGLAMWIGASSAHRGDTFIVPLLAASLSYGIGFAICSPGVQSMAPRLVDQAELSTAVALIFAIPMALGRSAGPVGGAALATAASPAIALGVVACAHFAFAIVIARVKSPRLTPSGMPADELRIGSAIRYVQRDRRLLALLIGVAIVGFGAEPAITLAPAMADRLGQGVGGAGQIASAFGLGSLLGVVIHKVLQTRVSATILGWSAMLVLGFSIGLASVGSTLAPVSLAMGLAGASMLLAVTGFSVAVQETCPPDMLGRVMALWLIAFLGVRPLAGISQGLLADHFSVGSALLVTTVVVGACAGIGLWMCRTPAVASPPANGITGVLPGLRSDQTSPRVGLAPARLGS
jgi:MFS family permease